MAAVPRQHEMRADKAILFGSPPEPKGGDNREHSIPDIYQNMSNQFKNYSPTVVVNLKLSKLSLALSLGAHGLQGGALGTNAWQ